MHKEELLNGWLPYRLVIENGAVKFRWLYVGTKKFTEPFFEESIASCLSLPENRNRVFPVTSAEELIELAEQVKMVTLSGFIYHISRCGSTLLSQMLACDQRSIVLSEVPLLDDVLRLRFRKDVQSCPPADKLFKSVLALLGQNRNADEQHLFVKTDSWHILFYDELRQFFPEVLAFLVFRSPGEVAASHAQTPSMQGVPGLLEPGLFGLTRAEVLKMDREHYLEHVLCSYLKKYAVILDSGDPVVGLDYHSGPGEMIQRLFENCGFVADSGVMDKIQERMNFHSKRPGSSFEGDGYRSALMHDFSTAEKLFTRIQSSVSHLKQEIHGA